MLDELELPAALALADAIDVDLGGELPPAAATTARACPARVARWYLVPVSLTRKPGLELTPPGISPLARRGAFAGLAEPEAAWKAEAEPAAAGSAMEKLELDGVPRPKAR